MSARIAEMIVKAMNEWFKENLHDTPNLTYEEVKEIVYGTMDDRATDIEFEWEGLITEHYTLAIESYVDDVIEDEMNDYLDSLPWM